MAKHECKWFYPDFDNSAYAHCMECPAILEPKEIATRLNATSRLSAKSAGVVAKRMREALRHSGSHCHECRDALIGLAEYADILEE